MSSALTVHQYHPRMAQIDNLRSQHHRPLRGEITLDDLALLEMSSSVAEVKGEDPSFHTLTKKTAIKDRSQDLDRRKAGVLSRSTSLVHHPKASKEEVKRDVMNSLRRSDAKTKEKEQEKSSRSRDSERTRNDMRQKDSEVRRENQEKYDAKRQYDTMPLEDQVRYNLREDETFARDMIQQIVDALDKKTAGEEMTSFMSMATGVSDAEDILAREMLQQMKSPDVQGGEQALEGEEFSWIKVPLEENMDETFLSLRAEKSPESNDAVEENIPLEREKNAWREKLAQQTDKMEEMSPARVVVGDRILVKPHSGRSTSALVMHQGMKVESSTPQKGVGDQAFQQNGQFDLVKESQLSPAHSASGGTPMRQVAPLIRYALHRGVVRFQTEVTNPHLGKVDVHLNFSTSTRQLQSIHFIVHNSSSKEAFEQGQKELSSYLEGMGIQMDQIEINVDVKGQGDDLFRKEQKFKKNADFSLKEDEHESGEKTLEMPVLDVNRHYDVRV